MSSAIASARQRRAGISSSEPITPQPSSVKSQNGLTLPQIISLVDNRLINLEKFMKDSQSMSFVEKNIQLTDVSEDSSNLSQILDEFNNRFMLLAEEIAEIKDTLMKLQTYTMDVNKMLLDERVNVLLDDNKIIYPIDNMEDNTKNVFYMDDNNLLVDDIVK